MADKCGCRIPAITSAFQADEGSSILPTRSVPASYRRISPRNGSAYKTPRALVVGRTAMLRGVMTPKTPSLHMLS